MTTEKTTPVFHCKSCETTVMGEIEATARVGPARLLDLVKCPRCSDVVLLQYDAFDAACGDDGLWLGGEILWPAQAKLGDAVPESLRLTFADADECLAKGLYTPSVVMCRKVVEGICVEKGETKGNLAGRLANLVVRKVVDPRLAEWANELRLAGNEAAHDLDTRATKRDAKDAVEFTRALLEYMYTFEARFEKFKLRRSAGQAKAKKSS